MDIGTEGKQGTISVVFVPFCGEQFSDAKYIGFAFVCTAKGELTRKSIYDAEELG